jgi:hypothetical protein
MADSMFASLLNTVDRRAIDAVAHALGQPEQAVSRGMESSIAGLLGGLASKSGDSNALRKIFDILPTTPGAVSWSQMAGSVTDPDSSFMAAGKRLLPAVFGGGESAVTNGISRASGLPSGAVSTLLAMAAPVVMSFISKQLRDGGTTISGLGSLLQRESSSIRSALPPGLSEVFWPDTAAAATASPVIAQSVRRERSSGWLLPALATAAAVALGVAWLLNHAHRPPVRVTSIPTGSASRLAIPTNTLTCTLPATITLPAGSNPACWCSCRIPTPNWKRPPGLTAIDCRSIQDRLDFDRGLERSSITLQRFLPIVRTFV